MVYLFFFLNIVSIYGFALFSAVVLVFGLSERFFRNYVFFFFGGGGGRLLQQLPKKPMIETYYHGPLHIFVEY